MGWRCKGSNWLFDVLGPFVGFYNLKFCNGLTLSEADCETDLWVIENEKLKFVF
jgi:hypothetical protein